MGVMEAPKGLSTLLRQINFKVKPAPEGVGNVAAQRIAAYFTGLDSMDYDGFLHEAQAGELSDKPKEILVIDCLLPNLIIVNRRFGLKLPELQPGQSPEKALSTWSPPEGWYLMVHSEDHDGMTHHDRIYQYIVFHYDRKQFFIQEF